MIIIIERLFCQHRLHSFLIAIRKSKKKNDELPINHHNPVNNEAILQFIYPQTNTTVILIGCLHGSSSSADDVQRILLDYDNDNNLNKDITLERDDGDNNSKTKTTTVIVLELCTSRFANIRRELESRKTRTTPYIDNSNSFKKNWNNFWSIVSTVTEKRGLSTGIAAAILGGAAGLQTLLSGLDNEPGIEFITAMNYAEQNSEECDIILADRNVDETLRRIGLIPSVSIDMVRNYFIDSKLNWNDTYGELSKQLIGAIWGLNDNDKTIKQIPQIDMGKALTRNQEAIQDLARLTLPPLIFAEVMAFFFNSAVLKAVNYVETKSAGNIESIMTPDLGTNSFSTIISMLTTELGTVILVLFLVYILIALPAAKLVLIERDEPLAKGIQVACQLAAEKSLQNNDENEMTNLNTNNRVVAVVGLLHVNGVVKRLLPNE
mmetsp:Transcript_30605/g.29515  ORF Transcript_30605/g.29515 Transcript_30605/m.29515 type:complete len:435 (-) Transcript_30605:100-1404(-)